MCRERLDKPPVLKVSSRLVNENKDGILDMIEDAYLIISVKNSKGGVACSVKVVVREEVSKPELPQLSFAITVSL